MTTVSKRKLLLSYIPSSYSFAMRLRSTVILSLVIWLASMAPQASATTCAKALVPQVISEESDIPWLPKPNRARWIASETFPSDAPVTGAYVLAGYEGKFLLGRHRERGWDIPGGHVDAGESPEHAAERETFEEAAARLSGLKPVAYQELEILGPKPEHYAYPYPRSYQALYAAQVTNLSEFREEEDMVERGLFTLAEVVKKVPWTKAIEKLFAAAQGTK